MIDAPDLVGLADAIATGAVTAAAAVDAAIEHALAWTDLNAVVALDAEAARERAHRADRRRAIGRPCGPLHGVPLAHKDMFYRAGRISGCGSRIRADFIPDRTATLLQRLDAAGAIDIGRLHMAEFAMGPTGHNAHLGRCANPRHPDAVSGGSSSGSGAAVAAGIVSGSLGSDTGGSVRLPAGFCGVVGLKTTQGRLPMDGVMPLSESLDTVGPIARSSGDVALLMRMLTHEDMTAQLGAGVADLTIGMSPAYYGEGLDEAVAAAIDDARRAFVQLGARIVDVDLGDHADFAALAALIWLPEAAARHARDLADRPAAYGEQVRHRLSEGLAIPATAYLRACRLRALHLAATLAGPLAACDLLLVPLCRTIVPLAADCAAANGRAMQQTVGDLSALTRAISYLGLPAITTPMGRDRRGVPIGLQLVGRPNAEALLIRAAHAFERATHWLERPRPVAPVRSTPSV